MAVYAVGDVHGCLAELQALLGAIEFDASRDRLWFTGDLINRGPRSLEVLRLVHSLRERAVVVLGNHELTLLAAAHGIAPFSARSCHPEVLNAPDRVELLDWLAHCPIVHHDQRLGYAIVHAGIPPQWDLAVARERAAELEQVLRGPDAGHFYVNMFGDGPVHWEGSLAASERLRFITNAFTRMRYCRSDGALNLTEKGPPDSQAPGLLPWFSVNGRRTSGERIIFGHWGALGYYRAPGLYGLDSRCAWGGNLTALRLDDREQVFSVAHQK